MVVFETVNDGGRDTRPFEGGNVVLAVGDSDAGDLEALAAERTRPDGGGFGCVEGVLVEVGQQAALMVDLRGQRRQAVVGDVQDLQRRQETNDRRQLGQCVIVDVELAQVLQTSNGGRYRRQLVAADVQLAQVL